MKTLTLVRLFDRSDAFEVENALDMYVTDGLLSFELPGGTFSLVAANVELVEELNVSETVEYLKDEYDCDDCDDCNDYPFDDDCYGDSSPCMSDEDGPELGEASLFIHLSDGSIEVRHGTQNNVMLRKKNAREGDWDSIFEFFADMGYERVE